MGWLRYGVLCLARNYRINFDDTFTNCWQLNYSCLFLFGNEQGINVAYCFNGYCSTNKDIMNILKTKMCDRFYNLSPKICIYDLDGTVIDSSHRATHDEQGNIDLVNWKAKSTKDFIFQDTLLPLYSQLQRDYKNGDMVILCTARELGKWDWEYLYFHNIYFDRVISRPVGNMEKDYKLKKNQLRYLFTLPCYRDKEKIFYDDNSNNLWYVGTLGNIKLVNPRYNDLSYLLA